MSLTIIKAGICDTFQDEGRKGLQHLGINPGGVMDLYAVRTANILVGNPKDAAVLEMHFPAAAILFEKPCLIALTGANFSAEIDERPIALSQPVWVAGGSILQFRGQHSGRWCYLALHGGFQLDQWLNSYATHLKAARGGWLGRMLQRNDRIPFGKEIIPVRSRSETPFCVLPWKAVPWRETSSAEEIYVIEGPEANLFEEVSKTLWEHHTFTLLPASDRMGYNLKGPPLATTTKEQRVSSATGLGTIQLLPDGQLIVLMADHQTTGGYPRIGQVIQGHVPKLAQKRPGDPIRFKTVTLQEAQQLWLQQYRHLQRLEYSARIKLESLNLPL